jgi:hypothetical protein
VTEPAQPQTTEQANQPEQTAEPQPEEEGWGGENPLGGDDESEGEKGEGEAQAEQNPEEVVPEKYADFTDASGKTYAPESLGKFAEIARKNGMTQAKAQEMFEAIVPVAESHLKGRIKESITQWKAAAQSDAEIGGANYKENLAIARQAFKAYGSAELDQIFAASGLGNHPAVLRMFYRVGKTLQQDKGVSGNATAPAKGFSRYPKSNMIADID